METLSGMGKLRDVAKRGDDDQCEEGDAALDWCDAEPKVSEAEWPPLISDALATAKHGKAVGPVALSCQASQGWRNVAVPASASAGSSGPDDRRSEGVDWRRCPRASLQLAEQLGSSVRERGGRGRGQVRALVAGWASGSGGRCAPAWGRTARELSVSVACLQISQGGGEDEAPSRAFR